MSKYIIYIYLYIFTLILLYTYIFPSIVCEDTSIHSFDIHLADSVLDDVHQRLELARYPAKYSDNDPVDWKYGTEPSELKYIIEYWKNEYNYRKNEELINSMNHYTTNIDNMNIHFIHEKSKSIYDDTIIPLLLVHGWGSTPNEFYQSIPLLISSYNNSNITYNIVAPSLPGYFYSDKPKERGWDGYRMADLLHKLMLRLGYNKYIIAAGDWGAVISGIIAQKYPQHVDGYHTTFTPVLAPWIGKGIMGKLTAAAITFFPSLFLTSEEREYFERAPYDLWYEASYFHQQATKPLTLLSALEQSPVALAGWWLEKTKSITDTRDGLWNKPNSMDHFINTVMFYWTTNSITSSTLLYYEHMNGEENIFKLISDTYIPVPTAVTQFKYELSKVPLKILKYYYNVVQFNIYDFGGHFPSIECPDVYVNDIRTFVEQHTELGRNAANALKAHQINACTTGDCDTHVDL